MKLEPFDAGSAQAADRDLLELDHRSAGPRLHVTADRDDGLDVLVVVLLRPGATVVVVAPDGVVTVGRVDPGVTGCAAGLGAGRAFGVPNAKPSKLVTSIVVMGLFGEHALALLTRGASSWRPRACWTWA